LKIIILNFDDFLFLTTIFVRSLMDVNILFLALWIFVWGRKNNKGKYQEKFETIFALLNTGLFSNLFSSSNWGIENQGFS